jgi:hypothetical protein
MGILGEFEMRMNESLCLGLSAFCFSSAFGADEEISREGVSIAQQEHSVFSVVGSAAVLDGLAPSVGLRVGYEAHSRWQIDAGYSVGHFPFFVSIRQKSATLDARYFLGDSFYLGSGAYYRRQQVSSDAIANMFGNDEETVWEFQSVGADLFLGNRWRMGAWTLGCDWFGVSRPLWKEPVGDVVMEESWKKRYEPIILRAYLGTNF